MPRLPRPVETPPTLAIAGPDSVDLDSSVWRPLEFTVGPASLAIDQAVVSVEYDAGALEIEAKHEAKTEVADEWQAISSGQPQRVQWRRNDPRVLAYRVRPRSPGPKAVDVAVSLTARGQTASHHLQVRVRAPEVVELAVSGPPLASDRPPGSEDRLRLLPFPNRVTPYRLQLVNRSGKARKVRVELWSRPPSASTTSAVTGPATAAPGHELPRDATGMLRPGFERLHGPLDVDLPADPTPVGIPFPPPQPAGGAESSKPAAGAASAPPADQRPVVSAGWFASSSTRPSLISSGTPGSISPCGHQGIISKRKSSTIPPGNGSRFECGRVMRTATDNPTWNCCRPRPPKSRSPWCGTRRACWPPARK